jgi:hypothetical protein
LRLSLVIAEFFWQDAWHVDQSYLALFVEWLTLEGFVVS